MQVLLVLVKLLRRHIQLVASVFFALVRDEVDLLVECILALIMAHLDHLMVVPLVEFAGGHPSLVRDLGIDLVEVLAEDASLQLANQILVFLKQEDEVALSDVVAMDLRAGHVDDGRPLVEEELVCADNTPVDELYAESALFVDVKTNYDAAFEDEQNLHGALQLIEQDGLLGFLAWLQHIQQPHHEAPV